ncbi:MAG: hypothetical protein GY870_22825 [archaeon]|nr:hypothetical protein [archaeon]
MANNNNPDEPIKNESQDPEDYEYNIKELQRIIHDHPEIPGMQSRFARSIMYLQNKKKMIKEGTNTLDDKQHYIRLLKIIEEDLDSAFVSGSHKFKNLLSLAKLREKISEEKSRLNF